MDALNSNDDLLATAQANLVQFLRTDLAICTTFADLAETEKLINPEHAQRTFVHAEQGAETIERLLPRVEDPTASEEIQQGLGVLRLRLQMLEL